MGGALKRSKLARTGSLASAFLNVWIFDGNPDESTSARAYREGQVMGSPEWGRRRRWINRLFRDPDHCAKSHAVDMAHARELLAYARELIKTRPHD
jgi:hypothetical protein